MGAVILPIENYAPLVIDSDAVTALQIAFQFFQPVTRRNHQILQDGRVLDHVQLAPGGTQDILREFRYLLVPDAIEDFFCQLVAEGLNQGLYPYTA